MSTSLINQVNNQIHIYYLPRITSKNYIAVKTVEIGEFKAKNFSLRGTDCKVNPTGQKFKSVPAMMGVKLLFFE